MSVEINVKYQGGLRCAATHAPSSVTLTTDAPVDNGGKGASFSPTDLVATAVGACALTIMGSLAGRENLNLEGTQVKVTKDMATTGIRRIGQLALVVTFPKGSKLSDVQRSKLEKALDTCPVVKSLHPDVKVKAEFVYPV